ncbi:Rieske (2Fe-2S) protein [Flavobacterium acetivorans]|uniref:Rieske (2Fe-2S) protein n=1 Tax=Flavobacterium acetivorans TaxID=2893883 RepID=UPI001E307F21|nr:hypothetical protein [Flavobacterium sp. F-29]UFH36598.1 hypothetical protein LNP19_06025 [Flavobacterium sp. F-29]
MKKHLLLLLIVPFFFGCSDNGFNNKNPYIPNYSFSVNLNLAFYQNLTYPGNAIYYSGAGVGSRGIYVFNTGSGYNAFDAACPNQSLDSCTNLTLKGINLVCPCDKSEYSLYTGLSQSGLQYPLKQYRVEVNGTVLRVYN